MENKLLPDDNTFKKWAEFCSTYRGDFWKTLEFEADFIPKKEENQNEDDYLKSMIELMFKNLDKEVQYLSYDGTKDKMNCSGVIAGYGSSVGKDFGYRGGDFHQDFFPDTYIAKVVLDFIFVISWVGIGYFVAAIQEQKSKLKLFANIIAGVFDTAFIISLFFGVPLFSVPIILAGIVSLVLRIVFAIRIGKNISETKREKQEFEYNKAIYYEIFDFLEKNRQQKQKYEKEVKIDTRVGNENKNKDELL